MSTQPLHSDEYTQFCEGVRSLTGIDLAQYKRPQMERRIRSFADRRGITSLTEYLTALAADPEQLEQFLDRVTINVSQLWRNPEQFARLANDVIHVLAETGRIRCWSAGCSYGAEAYTLAALCKAVAPGAAIEVHGTDIDSRIIARAREACFSAEDMRSVPAADARRWFDQLPDGRFQAKPELRMLTKFQTGDLLRDPFRIGHYDLVLCRNVVIYFNEQVRDELHARLVQSLRPGGYLMIGSSERITAASAIGIEISHPFIYRRA